MVATQAKARNLGNLLPMAAEKLADVMKMFLDLCLVVMFLIMKMMMMMMMMMMMSKKMTLGIFLFL